MKKENLFLLVALVTIFFLGLYVGTNINDKGRYFKTMDGDYSDVFDTKTGLIYRTGVDNDSRWFQKLDIKNAEIEELTKK